MQQLTSGNPIHVTIGSEWTMQQNDDGTSAIHPNHSGDVTFTGASAS
jgi:hypothetical protein